MRSIDCKIKTQFFVTTLGVCLALVVTMVGAQAPPETKRLSVEDAVRYALRQGVEAAIARQDVAAAQAGVGVALSYALPHIDLLGTYTRNVKKPVIFFELEPGNTQSFEMGQDNAWLGTMTLNQTLWGFGRVRSGYRAARDRAEAATQMGDDAAAAIARNVKAAYYFVLLAGERTEIARRSLEQAELNVTQIGERVSQGVAPEFDKLRAEVTVARRRPLLTRTRNEESIALESLKRLLGIPLDHPVELTDSLEYVPYGGPLDELIERALGSRRDLAAARSEAYSAENAVKAQAANTRPWLTLNGNLTWQGETSDDLWPGENQSAASAGVGLSLTWPIIDGFRNRNETRARQAEARKARLRVTQTEDIVRLDVRSNWADVQSIAQEIVGAEQAVEVAREAYRIAQVRYGTGLSTLIEFLDAEISLIEAALTLSETLYRYNVAVADLEYSLGEGPALGLENGE